MGRLNGVSVFSASIALGTMAAWIAAGLLTSLTLAGRRVFVAAVGLACGVCVMGVLLSLCFFHDSRRDFEQMYFSICLVCCLFGCGAAFMASWRRHLISQRTLWLAAILVLASGSTAVAFANFAGMPLEWKYLLPVLGGCGLAPIPLAAAPLAVYVNRHS